MQDLIRLEFSRKSTLLRLVYSIIFLIIFELIGLIFQLAVLFQFIYILITKRYSMPLRQFSNRLSRFAYQVMRYATINENKTPFPFSNLPQDYEQPEDPVKFS